MLIFGADGSDSKHSEDRKDDLIVLDKAPTVIKRVWRELEVGCNKSITGDDVKVQLCLYYN